MGGMFTATGGTERLVEGSENIFLVKRYFTSNKWTKKSIVLRSPNLTAGMDGK